MSPAKRGLTVEDLFDMRWLQGARLSSDGTRIVYSVTHVQRGESDDREISTIYLHDLDSGATRQLTAGAAMDTDPAWSPDGRTIAFLSDRPAPRGTAPTDASGDAGAKSQIFLLSVDGGEARRLTSLGQGAGAPAFSPDGTRVAFSVTVDPGKIDRSKDPYRVTRLVWRFDNIGDLDLAVSNLHITEVAGGATRRISDHDGMVGGIRWAPDGASLSYSVSMLPDKWEGFHRVHYVVRPDGAVVHRIADRPTFDNARWLPDGRRLVLSGVESEDTPIGVHPDLWVYDLETGRAENRTAGMELDIDGVLSSQMPAHRQKQGGIVTSSDGRYAYVQVQRAGRVEICRIALEGSLSVESLVSGDRACYLYDAVDDRIVFATADIVSPPELAVAELAAGTESTITTLNEELLSGISLPTQRELHFSGIDGTAVHGWYVAPEGASSTIPTILWIHGGPHGAQGYQFAPDTLLLTGAGYGVMFVNHRASTGYGDTFSTAIHADWGNLDYNDLMAGVDYAVAEGLADGDRLGCCGISGGGNLSCWIVGNTRRFKAAVPQNPVTNWRSFYGVSDIGVWFARKQLGGDPHEIPEVYDRCSPITYAHTCTTPTLLIQCEDDFRCPAEQSEQFYTILKANGCTVEMLRQPKGSHGGSLRGPLVLRRAHAESKLAWFRRHIPV